MNVDLLILYFFISNKIMMPDNVSAQPFAQRDPMNLPPPNPYIVSPAQPESMNPPPSYVPSTVPAPVPSVSNNTVVSPVIQVQTGSSQVDSSQNQMMMQMMQLMMMKEMTHK